TGGESGIEGIDLPGRGRADQVAAATRQGQRRRAGQEHAPFHQDILIYGWLIWGWLLWVGIPCAGRRTEAWWAEGSALRKNDPCSRPAGASRRSGRKAAPGPRH